MCIRDRLEEARRAVAAARQHPGATLVEFQVVQEGEGGNVYPMVPAGAALHEMIRRPVPAACGAQEEE